MKNLLPELSDSDAESYLVLHTGNAAIQKLQHSRLMKDRRGWHTEACKDEDLLASLKAHIEKNDMLDAAILAAMLFVRQEAAREYGCYGAS